MKIGENITEFQISSHTAYCFEMSTCKLRNSTHIILYVSADAASAKICLECEAKYFKFFLNIESSDTKVLLIN